jgi:hypothetical protein
MIATVSFFFFFFKYIHELISWSVGFRSGWCQGLC